jgi:hypothetical protein
MRINTYGLRVGFKLVSAELFVSGMKTGLSVGERVLYDVREK